MGKLKNKENLDFTTNRKVYKMAKRKSDGITCIICGINSGCNYKKRNHQRNWKKYRRTQWKE